MLHSSKNLSEYIGHLLQHETALFGLLSEKEGPKMVMILPGVLKMLAMGSDEANLMVILKNKSSTVSISYEYDPTDVLKIPQLIAETNNEVYVKEK
jgi:hypothetical protein